VYVYDLSPLQFHTSGSIGSIVITDKLKGTENFHTNCHVVFAHYTGKLPQQGSIFLIICSCMALHVTILMLLLPLPPYNVRFQVLMVVSTKMKGFWDMALCSLVGVDQCLRAVYYLHHQGVISQKLTLQVHTYATLLLTILGN
jgi:hypothetical protein